MGQSQDHADVPWTLGTRNLLFNYSQHTCQPCSLLPPHVPPQTRCLHPYVCPAPAVTDRQSPAQGLPPESPAHSRAGAHGSSMCLAGTTGRRAACSAPPPGPTDKLCSAVSPCVALNPPFHHLAAYKDRQGWWHRTQTALGHDNGEGTWLAHWLFPLWVGTPCLRAAGAPMCKIRCFRWIESHPLVCSGHGGPRAPQGL